MYTIGNMDEAFCMAATNTIVGATYNVNARITFNEYYSFMTDHDS